VMGSPTKCSFPSIFWRCLGFCNSELEINATCAL
jgi:hypothetical protein